MATKPLRSIKFPGLTDTYTVAATDTTLTIAGEPADAKATGDALAAKAIPIGSYEGMTAGSAEQLLATTGAKNRAPYTLRQTGGGVTVGDRAEEKIIGGTIAWNQLVDSATTSVTLTSTYKYISFIGGTWTCGESDGTALTVTGGTDMVFDLTQMFRSAVANAVYAMEQATTGAGVAWFRAMFPESYYPYNAGELMSVQTSGKRVTSGFNLFDKEAATLGKYYQASGQETVNADRGHSDFIQVTPGVSYYTNVSSITNVYRTLFFDSAKQYVGRADNPIFTAPEGAVYMAINFPLTDVDSLVVNISDPAKNGTYKPYAVREYPLDSSLILRGFPKWDSVKGTMYYDGDEYTSDGRVKWRYGIVDLGTLAWSKRSNTTYPCYAVTPPNFKKTTISGQRLNAINSRYGITAAVSQNYAYTTSYPNRFLPVFGQLYGLIFQADPATDPGDATSVKTMMQGVYLVYELDTPATDPAAPYTGTQWVEEGGTEAFIDAGTETGRVAVPVGHDTFYPTDLRGGLETLLETDLSHADAIAPVQGGTASTNIASGELLMQDGKLYKATQAIVAGAEIGATNTTLTTIAAQLAALEARIAALEN